MRAKWHFSALRWVYLVISAVYPDSSYSEIPAFHGSILIVIAKWLVLVVNCSIIMVINDSALSFGTLVTSLAAVVVFACHVRLIVKPRTISWHAWRHLLVPHGIRDGHFLLLESVAALQHMLKSFALRFLRLMSFSSLGPLSTTCVT